MARLREIAVIDDDASMSRAIERLLAATGWASRSFSSAEGFLRSDLHGISRIFILDVELPGMSGIELHEQLNAEGVGASVIYITGHDQPHLRAKAEQAGAAAYFTKPFEGKQLIDAVRAHLPAA